MSTGVNDKYWTINRYFLGTQGALIGGVRSSLPLSQLGPNTMVSLKLPESPTVRVTEHQQMSAISISCFAHQMTGKGRVATLTFCGPWDLYFDWLDS